MALSKAKKRGIIITASVLVVIMIAIIVTCCILFIDKTYKIDLEYLLNNGELVFSDEFEGDGLNQNILINGERVSRPIWQIADTFVDEETGVDTGIRRGAYWNDSQIKVADGKLTITTEQKEDGNFYTAGIATKDNSLDYTSVGYKHKYGYYEIKCKLPKGYGLWSAFWMMSDNFHEGSTDATVNGAEIDIMESPCYPAQTVQQAVHKGGYDDNHASTANLDWMIQDLGDIYDSYHTYGVYWDENIYKFYVDRKCVWTTDYSKNVSSLDQWLFISVEIAGKPPVKENGKWIPQLDSNPWIGGKYPTENGAGWKGEYVIDYVKVWDAPKDLLSKTGGLRTE